MRDTTLARSEHDPTDSGLGDASMVIARGVLLHDRWEPLTRPTPTKVITAQPWQVAS
jgi:hypothetical protein